MPLEVTFNTADVYDKPLTIGHFVTAYQPPSTLIGFNMFTYSPYLMVDNNDVSLENNQIVRGEHDPDTCHARIRSA